MSIVTKTFGFLPDGREVQCYTLENSSGMKASILNFGCVLQSLWVPTKNGELLDVVLGYDSLDGYLTNDASLGAVVGRLVGPVPDRLLRYKGKTVKLPANTADGGHCHGGVKGFSRSLWRAQAISETGEDKIVLQLISQDGDDGYPGELSAQVVYTLREDNTLSLDYSALADRDTPYNPAFHCYYNLSGQGSGCIDSQFFFAQNEKVSVNGKLIPAKGSVLDLREKKTFGERFSQKDPLTENGLDNFHLLAGDGMRKVMEAESPDSGCVMEVFTDAVGAIVYTGNWLNNLPGKNGCFYHRHDGFCFETCYVKDVPDFNPSNVCLVGPGRPFESHMELCFSWKQFKRK